MRREKVIETLELALKGSRRVKITFLESAVKDAAYLVNIGNAGQISFEGVRENNYGVTLIFAERSGSWKKDEDRTTTFTLTETFDENWFVEQMSCALESIEVVD